jgi:hypothetical protein
MEREKKSAGTFNEITGLFGLFVFFINICKLSHSMCCFCNKKTLRIIFKGQVHSYSSSAPIPHWMCASQRRAVKETDWWEGPDATKDCEGSTPGLGKGSIGILLYSEFKSTLGNNQQIANSNQSNQTNKSAFPIRPFLHFVSTAPAQ